MAANFWDAWLSVEARLEDCRFSEELGPHTNTNELSELHHTTRTVAICNECSILTGYV